MKNIYKYIAIFISVFLISFTISSVLATGDSPQFNYIEGDYKTLRGANLTQGETDWHDPVSAKVEDTVNWNVYIHNGVEGVTAHNVRVRVDLPQNQADSHTLDAQITSDDTEPLLDSASLNLDQPAKIDYITGSTELYNRDGQKVQDLPDGITESGINIGDIQGCWPYAVFVVFKTKISVTPEGTMDIYKTVRNLSQDESFSNSTTANTSDNLEYQILIENNTNHRVDFKLIDELPLFVSYIQDSLVAEFNNNVVTIYDPEEDLFNIYKDLHLEAGKTLKLTFQVDIHNTTAIGTIFRNTVTLITEDQTETAYATTTIIPGAILGVKIGEVLGAAALPVTGNPITVSLALAFAATSFYYAFREKYLFDLDLRRVRVLN